MSGEASSAWTAATCASVGSWSYSTQQCRLAMTTSAPADRDRAAAASMAPTSGSSSTATSHSRPAGGGPPLRPYVAATCPTRTPPPSTMVGWRLSAGGRDVPLWAVPARPAVGGPRGVQGVQGPDQAVGAVVQGVVGRRGAQVLAGTRECTDYLGLDGEARIAAVGTTRRGDGRLEVADREVGGADDRRDRHEDG